MSSPSNAVIEVEHLSRSFRRKDALKNVTLRVPEGNVFGLVGENGSGKTTLINHILGALRPQRGRVRVFGKDCCASRSLPLLVVGFTTLVSWEGHVNGGALRLWAPVTSGIPALAVLPLAPLATVPLFMHFARNR